MPNDRLEDYANQLPEIYREILAAFPEIEPSRKAGDGLAFQTLAIHFANTSKRWGFGDVQAACEQLRQHGFLEIKNGIFAHPTDLGEQLIGAVTRKPPASKRGIPSLPARTW
jgi:hypothetical protein